MKFSSPLLIKLQKILRFNKTTRKSKLKIVLISKLRKRNKLKTYLKITLRHKRKSQTSLYLRLFVKIAKRQFTRTKALRLS